MADEPKLKSQDRNEQRMAGAAGRPVDRKPVDQHSVSERPSKGSPPEAMTDGKRPVLSSMPGGCGVNGFNPRSYPILSLLSCYAQAATGE